MELHIGNKNYSSWSLRPWALMTQLGIPFTEHVHPFGAGSNFAAFSAFSPSGKVPCLRDGDLVVWDSLAIAEYLAEREPRVWPADRAARAWARSASAEMHSGFTALRQTCPMNCGLRVRLHGVSEALAQDLRRLQALWREGLARFGGRFLAGDAFTAVDAFFAPVAFRVQSYGLQLDAACQNYVERLLETEAVSSWYAQALDEPWIEPGHDENCLRHGELVLDLRAVSAGDVPPA